MLFLLIFIRLLSFELLFSQRLSHLIRIDCILNLHLPELMPLKLYLLVIELNLLIYQSLTPLQHILFFIDLDLPLNLLPLLI